MQWIARKWQINDGRMRKGKHGTESVPVDGRRVLQGARESRFCPRAEFYLQKFPMPIHGKTRAHCLDDLRVCRLTQSLRINIQESEQRSLIQYFDYKWNELEHDIFG